MPLSLSENTSAPKGKKRAQQMASWDANRQAQYRYSGHLPSIHFLLDASGSMCEHRVLLCQAYNQTVLALRECVSPLASLDCWTFHETSQRLMEGPIGTIGPLTLEQYQPSGGTRLKSAIRALLDTVETPGQHILIVCTDGLDDDATSLTGSLKTLVAQKQADNWLCIYLGAFSEALAEGLALGFHEGNCLIFEAAHLAQAFTRLRESMQRFLQAGAGEQKLLAAQGIFA